MTSVADADQASEKSEKGDKDKDVSDTIAVEIVRGIGNQREKTEFSDVTVVVDGMEFKCHRVILAACSGFFDGLFASGMKEDIEGRVYLSDIAKGTFTQVLECIYKGKNVLTESNIFEVWHAANHLHILFMLTECEKYLKDTISPDNCLAIYQQSKLLDSKTMTPFSWDYILKHFDSLRSFDELLMLTVREMMALVGSPHLVTASEDRVIETILKWIEFDPDQEIRKFQTLFPGTESDKECQNLSGSVNVSSVDASLEQPAGIAKLPTEKEDQGIIEKVSEKESKTSDTNHQNDRREHYLADLLKSSRICLVSGRCLMNTVWTNNKIQADPNALEIVQEAIEYQLETDRRHDYCPPTAIHRLSSNMETVIVALYTYNYRPQDTLICRKQDEEWYVLDTKYKENITAVCFDQNIFIANNSQQLHMYMTGNRSYKDLPSMSISARILYLLSLGSFLYAVHEDENHSIEALNVKDMLAGQEDCRWVQVGTLTTDMKTISCTTVVGNKLIFMGRQDGKDDTIVECFNTSTLTNCRLDDIPGTSAYMITFRKGKDAFALQRNGALWRITTCPTQPFVSISNQTLLWDFDRDLKGAVLFNDELQLFGSSFPTEETDKIWELCVPGVFKRVRNVDFSADYKCFMQTTIPKRYLSKKVF